MNTLFNKKYILYIVIIIVFVYFAFSFFNKKDGSIIYKEAKIDRNNIISYITSNGTLNPINQVEIGTQVNGRITNIYVDFNSSVTKNEILAEIDQAPFIARLKQSEADLKKAESDLTIANEAYEADKKLFNKRLISKEEFDNSKAKYTATQAIFDLAKASVDISKSNLEETNIRSPIVGIVLAKSISIGQTINTSKNPLFLISNNLNTMILTAHVSEADIGKVKLDQKAEFSVDAFPNTKFNGSVSQIRNEPKTINNIVTYDVIIEVNNTELKLKPGMTAEVNTIVDNKNDALRVPTSALRFVPPLNANAKPIPESTGNNTYIWTLTGNNQLNPVMIKTGISDDYYTEILEGDIKDGDEVVIEAVLDSKSLSDTFGPLPQPRRF